MAIHQDDSGRNYILKTFKGPLHKQIRECLSFIENEVIKSETRKITGQAENVSISNYPYNAIEEAISNAIYHKSYAEEKPVEIQVFPDKIDILSYPGTLPPVTNLNLQQRRVIARDYRNRRIGDFLKELKLTEGKATGFPLIKDEMSKNGSPGPVFYTDDERTLFLVTIPCHLELIVSKSVSKSENKISQEDIKQIIEKGLSFQALGLLLDSDVSDVKNQIRELLVSKSVPKPVTKSIDTIDYLKNTEKSREAILKQLGLSNHSKNYNTYLIPLIEQGIIEMTIPDKPNSQNQKYRLTTKGKQLLK